MKIFHDGLLTGLMFGMAIGYGNHEFDYRFWMSLAMGIVGLLFLAPWKLWQSFK